MMAEAKKMAENPEWKKKMKDLMGDKDFKQNVKGVQEKMADPDQRAQMGECPIALSKCCYCGGGGSAATAAAAATGAGVAASLAGISRCGELWGCSLLLQWRRYLLLPRLLLVPLPKRPSPAACCGNGTPCCGAAAAAAAATVAVATASPAGVAAGVTLSCRGLWGRYLPSCCAGRGTLRCCRCCDGGGGVSC